jgi:hypothetical protein
MLPGLPGSGEVIEQKIFRWEKSALRSAQRAERSPIRAGFRLTKSDYSRNASHHRLLGLFQACEMGMFNYGGFLGRFTTTDGHN